MPINYPNMADVTDSRGETPLSPSVFAASSCLRVIHVGLSMPANYSSISFYGPTSGAVAEFCGNNGLIYPSDGWAVRGTTGASGAFAGKLSELPYRYDQAVLAGRIKKALMGVANVGGTASKDWAQGGSCHPRVVSLIQQFQALGIPANYMFVELGIWDVANGVDATTFANNIISLSQGVRNAGYVGPIVYETGAWAPYQTQASYDAIIQGQDAGIAACGWSKGFNDDTLTGPMYRDSYSGVHWNDNGRYWKVQGALPTIPILN